MQARPWAAASAAAGLCYGSVRRAAFHRLSNRRLGQRWRCNQRDFDSHRLPDGLSPRCHVPKDPAKECMHCERQSEDYGPSTRVPNDKLAASPRVCGRNRAQVRDCCARFQASICSEIDEPVFRGQHAHEQERWLATSREKRNRDWRACAGVIGGGVLPAELGRRRPHAVRISLPFWVMRRR